MSQWLYMMSDSVSSIVAHGAKVGSSRAAPHYDGVTRSSGKLDSCLTALVLAGLYHLSKYEEVKHSHLDMHQTLM
jgi:hypothetical protein